MGCGPHPFLLAWGLVVLAWAADRLVGDPPWCPHPVVVMGWWISRLQRWLEAWAGDRPVRLRLAGGLITALLVGCSGLAGWGLEWLARTALAAGGWWAGGAVLLLTAALASALAGRSLEQAVRAVMELLPEPDERTTIAGETALPPADPLAPARRRLAWIVGRDTDGLDRRGILRALAETASENGVDGLFAPLFWMLVGAALWGAGLSAGPGPLALAWAFKAASTLDSMLGYRRGRLRWLGSAGARLDDLLVWLPCRLTAASLALAGGRPWRAAAVLRAALADGRSDPSPNAGVSQAAYAQLLGVQLGGVNHYGGEARSKPLLAAGCPAATATSVERMLALNLRLSALWLALAGLPAGWLFITKTLS